MNEDEILMEKFSILVDATLPQALFHVEHTDKDDETGAPLDDVILIDLLYHNKELLKVRDLKWFMKAFNFLD